MKFKDHFSTVATGYASFRPSYPEELFQWLASLPAQRRLAWDCACGNGQAALPLRHFFTRVVGTDASEEQIKVAPRDYPNMEWRTAPAEQSGLENESVDLITVAQALHWFDLPKFFAEAQRVLQPDGIVAVWCYGVNEVEGQELNAIVQDFYANVVGPYWPPERKIVEAGYRTLDFPFREVAVPDFRMQTDWDLARLLGYFRTWSATTRYRAALGHDPVDALGEKLAVVWGPPEHRRVVTWPLAIRAGGKLP